MLVEIFSLILETLAGFFSVALLTRWAMQQLRVSFRNPLGQFVIAVTDWAVLPTRRKIPSLRGTDSSSLLLAWLTQVLYFALLMAISGMLRSVSPAPILSIALLALLEIVKLLLYMTMGAVIVSALFSWVNPYAPMASMFDALTRPLLRPFRRLIPPVGGVDLSPLALLLLLQVALMVLARLRAAGLALAYL